METYHQKVIRLTRTHSYTEIAEKLDCTRGSIAGIVWRHKNPKMHTKNMSHSEHAVLRRSLYISKK